MIGGLAGRALSTQGGYMGNSGGLVAGLVGQMLPPINFGGMFAGPQQGQAGSMLGVAGQMIQNPNFGLVGQLTGINQAGNNQGLAALGGQPVVSRFNDPMTVKSVY
jgi:hypothetical protein